MQKAEWIKSRANPLIKQVRALRQRKTRSETGLFIVEGIHHIGEAVEAGWHIDLLLYAPDLLVSTFAQRLIAGLIEKKVRCQPVTRDPRIDG